MIYDIIGDIHGRADKLIGLLTLLDYNDNGQYWQPPANHQAIFIGDFVDRGAFQLETLKIAFDMIDHGVAKAVMGNHEYNAIGYATPHPDGGYCRARNRRNQLQHQAFLDAAILGSDTYYYWINRLYELPLWLELDGLNVVHACWDTESMSVLASLLSHDRCLNQHGIIATSTVGTPEFVALERVLKGIESRLPEGVTLTDGHGMVRSRTRIKWWLPDWQMRPLHEIAQIGSGSVLDLQGHADALAEATTFNHTINQPTFIGHYWLDGTPEPLSDKVVCTDYSAGKDGYLTAYRFDTDNPIISADNFIQYIHPEEKVNQWADFDPFLPVK